MFGKIKKETNTYKTGLDLYDTNANNVNLFYDKYSEVKNSSNDGIDTVFEKYYNNGGTINFIGNKTLFDILDSPDDDDDLIHGCVVVRVHKFSTADFGTPNDYRTLFWIGSLEAINGPANGGGSQSEMHIDVKKDGNVYCVRLFIEQSSEDIELGNTTEWALEDGKSYLISLCWDNINIDAWDQNVTQTEILYVQIRNVL